MNTNFLIIPEQSDNSDIFFCNIYQNKHTTKKTQKKYDHQSVTPTQTHYGISICPVMKW